MAIPLVDCHAHLDLHNDMAGIAEYLESHHILTLAVTTTPLAWHGNCRVMDRLSYVLPALGLHPELSGTKHFDVDAFMTCLPSAKFVGEVGVDGRRSSRNSRMRQKAVFSYVLSECERAGIRAVSVHSAGAIQDVLDVVSQIQPLQTRVILHWFSGENKDFQRAEEIGCYFSVNRTMLRSRAGSALAGIGSDRVVTETDSPFIKGGSTPLKPGCTSDCVEHLARIWKTEVSSAARHISETGRELLLG